LRGGRRSDPEHASHWPATVCEIPLETKDYRIVNVEADLFKIGNSTGKQLTTRTSKESQMLTVAALTPILTDNVIKSEKP